MKVFEQYLLDADWSVNAGNWLYFSCSSYFLPMIQLSCPVKSGREADPDGEYIRNYLPVLRKFPKKYIHEPWLASTEVQKRAGCVIGKDYPVPIIDHRLAATINESRMKQIHSKLYLTC